jgi:hypothetical protein
LPHLSMPKRGPKCKLGYYRVFNLIGSVSKVEMAIFTPPAQRHSG